MGKPLTAFADRRRIAVITLRGVIGGATRTSEMLRLFDLARDSKRIRAVVLVIDSPGGGATESEALYLGVKRLAAAKPVVAWIRGTGASGAYFAACGATRILAFPSAVVGSIGVISMHPTFTDVLRRLGIAIHVTKTGPFKDLGAPWREPSDEDEAKQRALVGAIFDRFSGTVRETRGLDDAALAHVTTGEVWLGEQALELGLIDGVVPTEDDAIAQAQRLAKLPRRDVIRMGGRKTVLQRLGMPGAGMGPPSMRWIIELDGWSHVPQLRLL